MVGGLLLLRRLPAAGWRGAAGMAALIERPGTSGGWGCRGRSSAGDRRSWLVHRGVVEVAAGTGKVHRTMVRCASEKIGHATEVLLRILLLLLV